MPWRFGVLVGLVLLPSVPAGTVTSDTPVAAFNFLEHHPGRIFTEYTWGDYSIVRHRQTFVDGRTDLFTGPVLTEFFAVGGVTEIPTRFAALRRQLRGLAKPVAARDLPQSRQTLADRRPHTFGVGLRPGQCLDPSGARLKRRRRFAVTG